jgi:SAM-dependent methyltransferase
MSGSRLKRIREHYGPRIAPQRPSYDVLDWSSPASQQARFRVLLQNVDLREKSLLDVGCGLGDLYAMLQQSPAGVEYTGVDIIPQMVQEARRRHPQGRFLCADIFQANPFGEEAFDVVFCSGTLNLNLGNNLAFLPTAIACFLESSRDYAVFNLLHTRAAAAGDDCYFHYDPRFVARVLKPLPCEIRMIDDYLHNDFTVLCRKKKGRHGTAAG